jgi:hypothetical protein
MNSYGLALGSLHGEMWRDTSKLAGSEQMGSMVYASRAGGPYPAWDSIRMAKAQRVSTAP